MERPGQRYNPKSLLNSSPSLKLYRSPTTSAALAWIPTICQNVWLSRHFSVRSGVPQGSHLGPLLFILFINDITSCFKSLNFLLYADDLKIFFAIRNDEDVIKAQVELDSFSRWCLDNKLYLNLGKCKAIRFSRSITPGHPSYVLSSHLLENVDKICDLGVSLDSKLNFTSHVDSIINKASRMLGYIRRIDKEFTDPYTLRTLYNC
jgi:Reverse transcriptase (RNA-dependent DNA polymerase)